MHEFFIHQATMRNSVAMEQLNKNLDDLKTLVNGDLAKKAAEDLTYTSDRISQDMKGLHNVVTGLCADLKLSQLAMQDQTLKIKSVLAWGWALFSMFSVFGTGVLCYVAYHAH